jgi:hypothetical protein
MNERQKDNDAGKDAVPPDLRQLARDGLKRERRRRYLFRLCGCLAVVAILAVLLPRLKWASVQEHDSVDSVSRAHESPGQRFPKNDGMRQRASIIALCLGSLCLVIAIARLLGRSSRRSRTAPSYWTSHFRRRGRRYFINYSVGYLVGFATVFFLVRWLLRRH